jgi:diguanylate cyclase (GGDEF)-like protein
MKSRVEWLVAVSVIVTLGFCVICGTILWEVRLGVSERAVQSTNNLIAALKSDIERNVELYDLSLQAVVDGMNLPQINTLEPEVRQLILFDRAATAKFLGSISVLDATGKVILNSGTLRPLPANYAAEDYFTVHRDDPKAGLFMKGPMADELGENVISISRRLTRPDGSFGGVVLGTLRLAYFQTLFTKMSIGDKSVFTLMQTDGRVLMRKPYRGDYIGRDISDSDVFKRVSAVPSGSYEGTATLDGANRIYAFSRIGSLPLIMTVGLGADEVYASWRREAFFIGLMMIVLCAVTIALGSVLSREWALREAAEQRLAKLAATDALTELPNRRRFDETIAREWARAQRDHTSLSLLMIDADHFKAYNDLKGHQPGDALLLALAVCIGATPKRPADLAARYGGEEFAVLLPDTPLHGACELANQIHARIAQLDFAHPTSPTGKPTVSIGIASIVPRPDAMHFQLLGAADAALYKAKNNGRNRTETASVGDAGPQQAASPGRDKKLVA